MALAYGFDDENHKLVMEEGEISTGLMFKNLTMSHSPSLGSPICANSSDQFLFQCNTSHQSQEDSHSLINFRGGIDSFLHGTGSLLSFQHNNYQWNKMNQKFSSDPRLVGDINCFQTASNFDSGKDNPGDWLYSEGINLFTDGIQESATQDSNFHKRPHMGESMQATKKQCNNVTKKPKPKSSLSKDPQSIAAKNRRERISERLKILQELVPNGTKVDLVTMLEKAISYVKFLQLQVKVLATDEFWPVQGGKAPDISQVKEAIDAILSSQKDRNSS